MTISIRKQNYVGHGSKGKLIRDLSSNLVEKRMAEEKTDFLLIPIVDLRNSIKPTVLRILNKPLASNNEVENALLANATLRDGEIVISRVQGQRIALFRNKEVMQIFEIVLAELNKKNDPATPAKVLQFKKVG